MAVRRLSYDLQSIETASPGEPSASFSAAFRVIQAAAGQERAHLSIVQGPSRNGTARERMVGSRS